jgi:hypothetical protein
LNASRENGNPIAINSAQIVPIVLFALLWEKPQDMRAARIERNIDKIRRNIGYRDARVPTRT